MDRTENLALRVITWMTLLALWIF